MRKIIVVAIVVALVAALLWWSASDRSGARDGAGFSPPEIAVLVQPASLEEQEFAIVIPPVRAAESVEITARVSNVVTEIHFDEGDVVKRGTPLVSLEASEARADYAEAQAALVESSGQFKRSRELLRTNAVSESEVERLEAQMRANEAALAAADARVQDHLVRAPFAGRVGLRRVSVGTLVTPGTVITTLDDLSTVLLDFDVPETHLAGVAAGQTLTARSAAYPNREFHGVVETIDSRVDRTTRAITVRARLPNDDGLLRPGMFMTVEVLRELTELLLIPEQAIVPRQERRYVFVVDDGVARRVEVETGRRTPGFVEIESGIEPGDVIVVEGTQHVRDGVPVETRPWPGSRTQ